MFMVKCQPPDRYLVSLIFKLGFPGGSVLLGYGCVVVFIVLSVVKCSLRVLLQQLLCSSGSVSCMRICSAGF